MRDLQLTENNTITIYDPLEKSEVVFTHRTPTTDDRVRCMTGKFKRQGDKLIDRSRSALIDAAADVMTAIRPGDFSIGGVAISSTPGEEGYREDWKELVKAAAGDLLYLMGHDLFEGKISIEALQDLNIVGEFEEPSPDPGSPVPDPGLEEAPLLPLATSSDD